MNEPCLTSGCEKQVYVRGLCASHYDYHYVRGTLEDVALPRKTRGKHVLSNIDEEGLTADCAECGPATTVRLSRGKKEHNSHYWRCRRGSQIPYYRKGTRPDSERVDRRYKFGDNQYPTMSESMEARARFETEQNGKCKICFRKVTLHLDHCHATGVFRGLLCIACNTSLGRMRDDVDRLERAAQYLREHSGMDTQVSPS